MYRLIITFNIISALALGSFIVNPGPSYPPTKGEVWPKPQQQVYEDIYYKFDNSDLHVKVVGHECVILTNAIERYTFIVRDTHRITRRFVKHSRRRRETNDERFKGTIKNLEIELTAPCEDLPHFGMEESYNLTVASTTKLTSSSIWGILRGLETWTQLFYFSDDYNDLFINKTAIYDFPRYKHRGLLVDTSRHYISVANILKTLDAMVMNKMNVLHWHIVDDQSFPYQSEKYPELSRLGAYHSTLVYSKSDIETIVNYAKQRGIRVLPEFDVPGHTRSWGVAHPEILTACYQNDQFVGLGPMDPTHNETYAVLQNLFVEIQEWFPEKYFHVGGDEVELQCWESNPDIQKYMREHNITSAAVLHALFMQNAIPLLGDRSVPIVWQEVFDEGVPLSNDTIIQVWKGNDIMEMVSILDSGHKLIYSSAWYLDHLKSGGDWTEFYLTDPRRQVERYRPEAKLENIVGGEACMWGEVVNDNNIMSRVWPRASAVAEKLWSANQGSAYFYRVPLDVYSRLEEHTCRMNRRGVKAQPPSGPGFCVGVP